jgi:hypothetical protein
MKINEIENLMLNSLVKLKNYQFNGENYIKVSDLMHLINSTDPDNKENMLDGLGLIPNNCFIKNKKYVLKVALLDVLF